ncbi:retrovirus-related pol polyprotein from transposon TNT 1-94 [Tanacetum coccineum]
MKLLPESEVATYFSGDYTHSEKKRKKKHLWEGEKERLGNETLTLRLSVWDKVVDFHWNVHDPWTIVSVSNDDESTGGGGTLQGFVTVRGFINMERGFLSSNLKTKNKNGDKNDKQTLHVDDDLVKNDLAAKIKNIDGKFVGRKFEWNRVFGTTRVSKEGIIGTSKDNSSGGNVQNLTDNIHAANGQPCDGFPCGLSQVDDQCKDSGTCGKQDVNAWDTPFIKPVSFENEPAVAIPSVAVEEVRSKFTNTLYGYFVGKRMERVLENGPWLIRLVLLILNIWSPNTILQKDEITLALVWVKLHNVPIVAYSEIGLSLITTKLGRPLMLDSYTSDMCLNPWGRNTYARALIEVSAAKALLDSLVVAIPLPNGKGNTLETINIEYEWKPQGARHANFLTILIHLSKKRVEQKKSDGFKISPTFNDSRRKVMGSKKGSNGEPTSGGTKEGDLKVPSPTRATSDLNTPFSNPFDVLNTVYRGCRSKKASKSQDNEDDSEEESEVKEYPLYDSTGISSIGGGFSLEDDDLACYDGYEAKLYNLSGKSQAFCDNYDIRISSIGGGFSLEDDDLACYDGYETQQISPSPTIITFTLNLPKAPLLKFHNTNVGLVYGTDRGKNHWEAVKWILKYLRGTANVGLVYGTDRGNHVDVTGFVDSDYAKDPDKGRSITGYTFLVQGCVVSWKATLQHVVALSTTEAEYMALTEAVKEAIWLRGLLEELGVELNTVAVNCDNQGAIHLSRNHVFHERTKHINVRYHFIREVLEAKTVKVLKVGTEHNAADALTKVVPGRKLQHCLELLKYKAIKNVNRNVSIVIFDVEVIFQVGQENAEFALDMCLRETLVLSGGKDKTVVLWSIHDHISTLATQPGITKNVGSDDKPAESPVTQARGVFHGHEDTVEDVQFCPSSGQEFCSVGDDSCLILWDARTGSSPVVKGLLDYTIRFLSSKSHIMGTGVTVHLFENHNAAVLCVQRLSLESSAEDGILNVSGDKVVDFHWNAHDPWTIVSVSNDDESTGGGGTLQSRSLLFEDPIIGDRKRALLDLSGESLTDSGVFELSGEWLVYKPMHGLDGITMTLVGMQRTVSCSSLGTLAVFLTDSSSSWLNTGLTDGSVPNTLVIANYEIVKPRVAAAEHISQFNEEARSPYVKKFKTIIHPGEVNRIRELPQNNNIVATHTDNPDFCPSSGQEFCSVGDDSCLILWDARTGSSPVVKVEKAHDADLHCVVWNPIDQNLILTGSADNTIHLFDRRNLTTDGIGSPIHIFENHTAAVLCVQWSPDKSSVFGSSAEDGILNVWDHNKIGESSGPASKTAQGLLFRHSGNRDKVVDFQWNAHDPWTIVSVSNDDESTGGGRTMQIWRMIDLIYRPEQEVLTELDKFRSHILTCPPE